MFPLTWLAEVVLLPALLGLKQAPKSPPSRPTPASAAAFYVTCLPYMRADPANPVKKEWLHWLVVNIPAGADISRGDEVGGRAQRAWAGLGCLSGRQQHNWSALPTKSVLKFGIPEP